jgi:hypothetical protein
MFLPFLKIVKKTLTRWSQVTKEIKDRTNPKQQALEETMKKTTRKSKNKEN